jgi:hypothetical protein
LAEQRLFNVTDACAYLGGISPASLRGLIGRGLTPVRLPSTRHAGEMNRRLLFAREDLDALIDRWRSASTSEPHPGLSTAALKGWDRSPVRVRRAK